MHKPFAKSHIIARGPVARLRALAGLSGCAALCAAIYAGAGEGVDAGTEWASYGNGLANQRFSPLTQINTRTAHLLEPAWRVETGRKGSFQATPIVHEGVMYVSLPFNDVLALDAATGVEIWRYRHDPTTTDTCCGPANRGVAVAQGRVYMATIDARLIALDAATGRRVGDSAIVAVTDAAREALADVESDVNLANATVVGGTGFSANMAPQVVGDLVLVGVTGTGYGLHLDIDQDGQSTLSVVGMSGGRNGLRGFLVAYDARTLEERWRWYSVPGPEWTGYWRRSTADGALMYSRDIAGEQARAERHAEAWSRGGGSIWTTPAVDEALGLVFLGTGNPAPQMDDTARPGDNLDTVSLVALDLATGEKRWAYQQVPHDRWGYDVASPPILFDAQIDGAAVPAIAQAGKTGWLYVLDRRNGRFLYKSEPFVPQSNMFAQPSAEGTRIAPGIYGGASWSPMSLHPGLGRFFVLGVHHPTVYFQKPLEPTPESPFESYTYTRMATDERAGFFSAIAADTGHMVWQRETPFPLVGGALATAGNVVFFGEGREVSAPDQAGGQISALDARDGRTLWEYETRFGVNAPPITYQVGDVQYVAVAVGGNSLFRFPTGDTLMAFRLPEEQVGSDRRADRKAQSAAGKP